MSAVRRSPSQIEASARQATPRIVGPLVPVQACVLDEPLNASRALQEEGCEYGESVCKASSRAGLARRLKNTEAGGVTPASVLRSFVALSCGSVLVVEPPFAVEGGHAAGARRRDGLAVDPVLDVSGGENALE